MELSCPWVRKQEGLLLPLGPLLRLLLAVTAPDIARLPSLRLSQFLELEETKVKSCRCPRWVSVQACKSGAAVYKTVHAGTLHVLQAFTAFLIK